MAESRRFMIDYWNERRLIEISPLDLIVEIVIKNWQWKYEQRRTVRVDDLELWQAKMEQWSFQSGRNPLTELKKEEEEEEGKKKKERKQRK